jgi:hypothetical protein
MDWFNVWINVGIGLLTGFISGLLSGLIVTSRFRHIDEVYYRKREVLEYLNQWSKYLSQVHFELLVAKKTKEVSSLQRVVFCKPITIYDKEATLQLIDFYNNIVVWLIDLNNYLITDRIDDRYLNNTEKELLLHQSKIREIVSTMA